MFWLYVSTVEKRTVLVISSDQTRRDETAVAKRAAEVLKVDSARR